MDQKLTGWWPVRTLMTWRVGTLVLTLWSWVCTVQSSVVRECVVVLAGVVVGEDEAVQEVSESEESPLEICPWRSDHHLVSGVTEDCESWSHEESDPDSGTRSVLTCPAF